MHCGDAGDGDCDADGDSGASERCGAGDSGSMVWRDVARAAAAGALVLHSLAQNKTQ